MRRVLLALSGLALGVTLAVGAALAVAPGGAQQDPEAEIVNALGRCVADFRGLLAPLSDPEVEALRAATGRQWVAHAFMGPLDAAVAAAGGTLLGSAEGMAWMQVDEAGVAVIRRLIAVELPTGETVWRQAGSMRATACPDD